MAIPLFELDDRIDRAAAAARFARDGRIQLRDLLTPQAAATVADILHRQTPWGLGWQGAAGPPAGLRQAEVERMAPAERQRIGQAIASAARAGDYAFIYARYPMLDAYKERWAPDHPLDLLFEHINDTPFLDLVRAITGMPDLAKADAQATLYAPGQFLSVHDDSHDVEGRRVAYVMNFAREWRPDWGGYLLFYDHDGDVVSGLMPRFNTLNLFAVPQRHNVSYVPPFAPVGRYAITGWFRDR